MSEPYTGGIYMQQPNIQDFQQLLEKQEGPCLSLYQATHRSHPENAQDPIRYKNLVKQLEQSLNSAYTAKETEALLKPFHALAENTEFWQHTLDGIAILANKEEFHIYPLQRSTPDFAVVADSWHLKPLLRQTQTQDRYQVLCVTRSEIQVFEGNRDSLDHLVFSSDFPDTADKALGTDEEQPFQQVGTYGLGPSSTGMAMYHGHGGKADAVEVDTARFFRVADKAVYEQVSKQSHLPLILVTLSEYQGEFRKISNNPMLIEQGLSIDPTALTVDQLREKTWEIMEPVAAKRVQDAVANFNQAHGTGLANADLERTLNAILDGRVETLLVDADKRVAGRINVQERQIELLEDFSAPDTEDILDDMAEMVLRRGGKVMVIPSSYMPTDSGLASIYRY